MNVVVGKVRWTCGIGNWNGVCGMGHDLFGAVSGEGGLGVSPAGASATHSVMGLDPSRVETEIGAVATTLETVPAGKATINYAAGEARR